MAFYIRCRLALLFIIRRELASVFKMEFIFKKMLVSVWAFLLAFQLPSLPHHFTTLWIKQQQFKLAPELPTILKLVCML
ncbi:hypothetical protein ASG54_03220 [Aureimonas sp. Leaf460]|nr:hypothetical protein ASG62_21255 [Aureimonas sp. Leaf427]KQT78047.1 hypothetical protein ASG54_03220 [Aureimonas sp. Leaf460]